jgi:uncharacterized protein (DUF2461 family)
VLLIEEIERHGIGVVGHDVLKTAPRGYPKDHPRIGLLRRRGLVAWRDWPAEAWLDTPEPVDLVAAFFDTTRPLADWLATRVGSSLAT